MEQWKDIKGLEGSYQVSNSGKVRSLDRNIIYKTGAISFMAGKILSTSIDRKGYAYVSIYLDKKHYSKSIHRLVASAFIPNTENKATVNHKDGNPLNNHVGNLEWATYSEQNIHAYRVLNNPHPKGMLGKKGLTSGKKGAASPCAKPIICINTGKIYGCISEAEKELNVNHISCVCNGRRNHTGGLKFKYA
jgi:hypothetical protein